MKILQVSIQFKLIKVNTKIKFDNPFNKMHTHKNV